MFHKVDEVIPLIYSTDGRLLFASTKCIIDHECILDALRNSKNYSQTRAKSGNYVIRTNELVRQQKTINRKSKNYPT